MAFLVLIAGAALREPTSLIWFVTGCSVIAYITLQFHAMVIRPALAAPLATVVPMLIFMIAIAVIQHTLLRRLNNFIGTNKT